MKSLILGLITALISVSAIGQGGYANYSNTSGGTKYEIQLITERPVGYMLYINMMPVNPNAGSGGIIIRDSHLPEFLRVLEKSKLEFDSLSLEAKKNGVLDDEKLLDIKCSSRAYFRFGKTWNLHQYTTFSFIFKVVDGVCFLVIRTGYLTSFDNENMNHAGFAFVFLDSDSISELSGLLLPQRVKSYIDNSYNFDSAK